MPEVVAPPSLYSFGFIYIPGKLCFFLCYCSVLWCAYNRVHCRLMVVFVYLNITLPHYHHYVDISDSTGLLKNAYKLHSVECVSEIKSNISIILHEIYGAGAFSSNVSLVMIVQIRVLYLIFINSEVRTYCHCLGLAHETNVCVVCPSLFFYLLQWIYDKILKIIARYTGVTKLQIIL